MADQTFPRRSEVYFHEDVDLSHENAIDEAVKQGKHFYAMRDHRRRHVYPVVDGDPVCRVADLTDDRQESNR